MEPIKNRVANSALITIDLEDYYRSGERVVFDIKDWLFQGIILKEKDFREYVKNHDWTQYSSSYVVLFCSVDVIIPSWAYLLITTELAPFAKKVIVGNPELLEILIFQEIVNAISYDEFKDKPIIIKGCSNIPIPEVAYIQLIAKLLPIAKSIMYGEACSSVPLFKAKK